MMRSFGGFQNKHGVLSGIITEINEANPSHFDLSLASTILLGRGGGNILLQVGAAGEYTPADVQVRIEAPIRSNPTSQVYSAMDPSEFPIGSTIPFAGGGGSVHVTRKYRK